MELLKIAQYDNMSKFKSKKKLRKYLKKVSVHYCIPDTLPGTQQIHKWAGYTILHFAVQSHDFDSTVELLNQGANMVKQGTNDGRTPLHSAYENIDLDILFGRTHNYSLINTLLTKQVETNKIFNPKCNDGVSHLHIACMVNHAQAVEFFAENKVPLDQPIGAKQFKGYTPLHCAIRFSSVEAAKILLQHGADVHIKNLSDLSWLHLLIECLLDVNDCITMGNRTLCLPYEEEVARLESIIKFVLKANDEIFVDDTGLSAFHVACTLRDKSIVEGYLKKGADLNKPVKSGSKLWPAWTPLHFAACIDIEIMLLLIENGANVTMRNLNGETPLDLCAKRFTPGDIQLILSKQDELKDISLSDDCTKLSDLLLAMNDFDKFRGLMKKLRDVNITIPLNSPLWPGYNLLHLCISQNERRKFLRLYKQFAISGIKVDNERYNCTEDEQALYNKRIELCLEYGCSVDMANVNGQTPIRLAFNMKSERTVEKLLSSSQVDVVDQDGLSHLHIACALRNLEAVKRYVSRGADLNSRARTSFEWKRGLQEINFKPNSTPLHVAALSGNQKIIRCLLENGADVYARDSLGRTPIHSMTSVDFVAARLLLEATPNLRDSVSAAGLSHLHVAAWANDRKAVRDLLRNGAKIDRVAVADVDTAESSPSGLRCAGKTALLAALDSWGYQSVKSLLKAGANAYAKDHQGVSVLQHALRNMSRPSAAPFVRLVKSEELDVESCGMTLLHVACATHDFELAKRLLENGADVNARIRDSGNKLPGATPLYVLVDQRRSYLQQQFVRFVELLVGNGADVTVECCGNTPLHLIYKQVYIRRGGRLPISRRTLALRDADLMLKSQKSCDVNPTDDQGVSHFHLACLRNDAETATKFLDRGVDVNASIDPFAKDNGGFTPLHWAMACQCEEVAYLLVNRGADVKTEDVRGNTPLHLALKNKFVDLPLFEAILNLGADIHAKNFHGETLFYCLLRYGGVTLDALQFFLDRGHSINIRDAAKRSGHILGVIMQSATPTEIQPILQRLVQIPEVKSAIEAGFDALKSIVSIENNDRLTLDDYLWAIEFLVKMGCNFDQTDKEGFTTLHTAAYYYNAEAVKALLQLGSDINEVNNKDYCCPFFDELFMDEDEEDYHTRRTGYENISKALASQVWKMRLVGLELKEPILKRLEKVEEEFSLIVLLEQSCQDELSKARQSEICQGLTVRDFLSELGAVAEYPRMFPTQRNIVDKYFKSSVDVRREFPELSGLLALQYRKVLARMNMWQPAKDAIVLICQVELPDLCVEIILRYFKNSEMKLLIEILKELV